MRAAGAGGAGLKNEPWSEGAGAGLDAVTLTPGKGAGELEARAVAGPELGAGPGVCSSPRA